MKFYKYWIKEKKNIVDSKGKTIPVTAWGSSNESPQEAQKKAIERLAVIEARIACKNLGQTSNDSQYEVQALREEVVQEIDPGKDVIVRNHYGALVLCSENTMFVDIDCPKKKSLIGKLKSLFGAKPAATPFPEHEMLCLDHLRKWSQKHADISFRIYKTKAGFRLLFTDRSYDPKSPETQNLMRELGGDFTYIRLCAKQECFRARLTAKPWRLRIPSPQIHWPLETEDAKRNFSNWLKTYEEKSSNFATSHLVEELGPRIISLHAQKIIEVHDRECKVQSSLPLA